jgi:tRNA (guanine10-N2)-dimethyltransferase
MAEILPKPFVERRPRKRPFFHPSAMPAKLARCMVNLAQPKRDDLILDSFCGTASILVEAWLIGCRVVGFDVQRRMVRGSLQNLLHYGVEAEGIAVADARHLPVIKIDCIVTDPPYGRLATTLGWDTRQIVEDFLSKIEDTLPRGKRICMASPKSIRIGKIGKELGFKHVESHFVYVHRSLTREIAVFERT